MYYSEKNNKIGVKMSFPIVNLCGSSLSSLGPLSLSSNPTASSENRIQAPSLARVATLIFAEHACLEFEGRSSLEEEKKTEKEFSDAPASFRPKEKKLTREDVERANQQYRERLRAKRLRKIAPPTLARKTIWPASNYELFFNHIKNHTILTSDQFKPLIEGIMGFSSTSNPTQIYNKKWEIINKYINCFNLFTSDSPGTVLLLNGERTSLPLSLFFNGIMKTMRTHLGQPNLSQDCEFSEEVGGRFFDIQFKKRKLTILSPGERLNSGGFGIVYESLELTTGRLVAQKIAKFSSSNPAINHNTARSFYDEFQAGQILPKSEEYLCAENILCAKNLSRKLPDSSSASSEHSSGLEWLEYRLSLTFRLCSNGDLFTLLERELSLSDRIKLASNVWELNKKLLLTDRTWHPDIKPENYLLQTFPKLALGDWAGTRHQSFLNDEANLDPSKVHKGTPEYYFRDLAAQIEIAVSQKNTELVAQLLNLRLLYMTATTMFIILCSYPPRPFEANNFQDMSKDVDVKVLKAYPKLLYNLILDLLHSDPKKRLSSWEEADKRFNEIVYKSDDDLNRIF